MMKLESIYLCPYSSCYCCAKQKNPPPLLSCACPTSSPSARRKGCFFVPTSRRTPAQSLLLSKKPLATRERKTARTQSKGSGLSLLVLLCFVLAVLVLLLRLRREGRAASSSCARTSKTSRRTPSFGQQPPCFVLFLAGSSKGR